jgi:phosphoenolpyruvate carboxykinase (ATP)
MTTIDVRTGGGDLSVHGLNPTGRVIWNPTTSLLYEHAVSLADARIAEGGPLAVDTGKHTGRSPKDKFIVREPGSEERSWGDGNGEIDEDSYQGLRDKVVAFLDEQPTLYVVNAFAGADHKHRIAVRVVTNRPYHALFSKTMFIDPTDEELAGFKPDALVLHAPEVEADPKADNVRTTTFVCLHPAKPELIVGGTFYAGEIKKSIFTVLNDRLPLEGVLPMHCSANV